MKSKRVQTEISEGFRLARASISDITADLHRLRRRVPSAVKPVVKSPRRPAKPK